MDWVAAACCFPQPTCEGPLVVLSQSVLSPISRKSAQNSNRFAASCSSLLFLGFLLSSWWEIVVVIWLMGPGLGIVLGSDKAGGIYVNHDWKQNPTVLNTFSDDLISYWVWFPGAVGGLKFPKLFTRSIMLWHIKADSKEWAFLFPVPSLCHCVTCSYSVLIPDSVKWWCGLMI